MAADRDAAGRAHLLNIQRARRLAALIYDGLDDDAWGDIDPLLFDAIGDATYERVGGDTSELSADAEALLSVLERALAKLDAEMPPFPKEPAP